MELTVWQIQSKLHTWLGYKTESIRNECSSPRTWFEESRGLVEICAIEGRMTAPMARQEAATARCLSVGDWEPAMSPPADRPMRRLRGHRRPPWRSQPVRPRRLAHDSSPNTIQDSSQRVAGGSATDNARAPRGTNSAKAPR